MAGEVLCTAHLEVKWSSDVTHPVDRRGKWSKCVLVQVSKPHQEPFCVMIYSFLISRDPDKNLLQIINLK